MNIQGAQTLPIINLTHWLWFATSQLANISDAKHLSVNEKCKEIWGIFKKPSIPRNQMCKRCFKKKPIKTWTVSHKWTILKMKSWLVLILITVIAFFMLKIDIFQNIFYLVWLEELNKMVIHILHLLCRSWYYFWELICKLNSFSFN